MKNRLKLLFLSKPAYFFYFVFIFLNILIFFIYFYNLTTFALNIKEFAVADAYKYYPSTLLNDRFSCSSGNQFFLCGSEIFLFLLLVLFVEVFAVWNTIHSRKKVHKLILILYLPVMQLFAILALLVLAYTPEAVFAYLSRQAQGEIKKSISVLNNPDEINKAGVETSPEEITSKIRSSSLKNFSIAESNPLKGAVLSYLKIPKKDKDTLYRAIIIPYKLDTSAAQKKLPFSVLLFPDNTLVVNRADKKNIERLVPVISTKMIIAEFNEEASLKNEPKMSFLNEIDYVVHQTRQEEKVKKEFEDFIDYLNNYIVEADSVIRTNQSIINSYPVDKQRYQREHQEYIAKWGNWYQECKSELGNDPICESGKTTIDSNIRSIEADINSVDEYKKEAERNLSLQIVYKNDTLKDLAVAKQTYQDFLKNPVTAEFQDGVFNPPDSIYIRYYDKEYKPLTYYLNTVIHEYLHAYSYNPDFKLEPFLDEGFTDFFKLVIEAKYIEPEAILVGYPDEVSIVEEMIKHLPEEKIIQFYFDQNQTGFQKLFVETYSPLDYENFILKGKNLLYASLKDEALKKKYVDEIKAVLAGDKK